MKNVLERLPPGARIALIRLRSLGDCVLTTPAISLLHQARPDLRIAVVAEDAFAAVFTGNPAVEQILRPQASAISKWRPHLAMNLHGGASSMRLTLLARAPLRAGFAHFRFRRIYNVQIPRAQEILNVDRTVHTAEHLASAMFFLGVPQREIPRAQLFAQRKSRPRPYAVLHPMASAPGKTWGAANFLSLASHIEKDHDIEPVFIGGPGENLAAFSRYSCVSGGSLEDLKSLLAGATLFAGNDSGPAHMAAAFGLPVLVFFGSSDPENWRPWKTTSAVLSSAQGIDSIRVAQAVEALDTLRIAQ